MRSSSSRRLAGGLTFALVLSISAAALGDVAQDKAMAVQLFKDGKDLMNKGNFVEACPKFEASARLDPTADGTILNLGLCYEGLGKFATAWGYFNESVARAKKAVRPDREQMAKEHIAAIEPKLSKVTIHVSNEARVDGLIIEWDGKPLSDGAWNTPVPVDSGTHHIAVMAPGHMRWEADVDVGANADKKIVDVPKLGDAAGGDKGAAGSPDNSTGSADKGIPTMTYVLAGAGIAMIGGGIGAHFVAAGAANDREAHCKTVASLTCDDDFNVSTIHRWDAISWGLIGAGVVSAGVGIGLYFAAKPSSATSASASAPQPTFGVSLAATGLRFEGAF